MKIILFGASGMVGAEALREALDAPEVESVLSIGRRPCGVEHPKLRELARALQRLNPELSFCYCSAGGAGGRSMWARVRQRVEGRADQFILESADINRVGT